jgi:hypothetical protein
MAADSGDKERDVHYRIYESIWRNMDREDTLISQRISWAILLSGGIFAASALLATGIRETSDPAVNRDVLRSLFSVLMFLLSAIGVYFSYRTQEGVLAAQNQLGYLKDHYYRFQSEQGRSLFEERYNLPRPFGDPRDHISGTRAAVIFPKMMMVVWSVAALVELVAATYFLTRGLMPPTLPN